MRRHGRCRDHGVAARPPEWPRDAMERMNTSSSVAWICIRTRSPRIAPPVMGRTGRWRSPPPRGHCFRGLAGERGDQRRFAASRRAGDAHQMGAASHAGRERERGSRGGCPVLDLGEQPRQRAPVAGMRPFGERLVGRSPRGFTPRAASRSRGCIRPPRGWSCQAQRRATRRPARAAGCRRRG